MTTSHTLAEKAASGTATRLNTALEDGTYPPGNPVVSGRCQNRMKRNWKGYRRCRAPRVEGS